MTHVEGGVAAPTGFTASGVIAGIKKSGKKKDCALIVSDTTATVAGMFTQNVMKAPPLIWDAAVCATGKARAIFINSGNANAATGERGVADVCTTADLIAERLNASPQEICVCSTGVIGVPLPMDRIAAGIEGCIAELSPSGSSDAAMAIMTTDTVPKEVAVEIPLSTGAIRMGAIAKGSGMIAPNMATMICAITTDASIGSSALHTALREAVEVSFNCICVDNDMSTSDIVLCLANGQSGGPEIVRGTADYDAFSTALTDLCKQMARELVLDGEGATKFVEIEVTGTATDDQAKTVARTIAFSQLCKTAFYGQDPNWGRIVCAAGYSGVQFDPADLALWLDGLQLVDGGSPANYREEDAAAVMKQREFRIRVQVGSGPGKAVFWTSDLSEEYVRINADYRS
jgi:glutamate N-acetyltransferase/amino-acid N-acetyltransferase